jgi:tripartite-type tricarboxylate transporter receptor subunit TctC
MKLLIALAASIVATAVHAQQWPAKPIRILLTNSAGSAPDVIARLVAEKLTGSLGQSVLVENRPGGNGFIAIEAAAKAAPDGYTYLVSSQDTSAANIYRFKSLPYDPDRDFTPVANLIDSAPLVLAVHPDLPIRSYPELVSFAKARQGKATIGVTVGLTEMLARWMNFTTGAGMEIIRYKSNPQSAQEAVSGQINALVNAVPSIEPLMKAGRLRVIAVSSTKRFPTLPDVPTLAETFPGLVVEGWLFLVAPTGTPQPIVQRMNREIDGILKNQDVVQRIRSFGFSSTNAMTPETINERIQLTRATWKKIAQDIKIQPE